jgi:hypothetical protein
VVNEGYRFDRWEGSGVDSTTSATATVAMDQNRTLVAHFALNTTDEYNQQLTIFGGETAPARIGPLADFDNDGKPNLLEYAYGLNAATGDPEKPVKSETPRKSGSNLHGRFRIVVRSDDPELSYTVGVTSNLSSWTHVPISFSEGTWSSTQPGTLTIASQTDLGEGLWLLILEDATAITDQPRFFRSDLTTPYD